ncbi:NAD-dependent epimerase [Thermaurantimonas aggregans]|uniref:NAD-dependent epimerase n=1 Tax=Thermaurantimonas aggregans TaxID=2173829 RepID=A0A401XIN9_9FLAO|nr:TIGR01777 family oxidoreductase [Thermaurantimonas aggregans]MCX8148823.1 TIGR01777 family oxidoreductase [Thermaurantimonas aggregans]GCD76880.1 NAD-dependent epimerase [Thermaurantimonas aggregans]
MSRTILVTGATGLVGRHLIPELKRFGYTIRTLTTSGKEDENTFYWNPEKGEINKNVFNSIHTIIHLAGSTIAQRWTPKARKSIIDSRVKGAQMLLQPAIESGLKRFITASAIGIYPQNPDGLYDEYSQQTGSDFPAEVVKIWEAAADEYEKNGVSVVKIRTGIVLDPEGGALKKMLLPVKLGIGSPIGSGKQMVSWIHIRDLVNIYVQAVVKEEMKGIYNATAPSPVSNRELMHTIAKVLGKPFFFPPVPAFMLRLMLGEMASITLEGSAVIPKRLLNEGFSFEFSELEDALRDLLT